MSIKIELAFNSNEKVEFASGGSEKLFRVIADYSITARARMKIQHGSEILKHSGSSTGTL